MRNATKYFSPIEMAAGGMVPLLSLIANIDAKDGGKLIVAGI
ncbi:MAG: hypothetical protein R3E60_00310 [Alphaproteobacteria bacterium]